MGKCWCHQSSSRWHHRERACSRPSDVPGQSAVHVKRCPAGPGPPRSADASHSSLINAGLMSKVIKCGKAVRERANLHILWWPKCKELCFRPLTYSETESLCTCPVILSKLLAFSELEFPDPENRVITFPQGGAEMGNMYKKNQMHLRISKNSYYYCYCCHYNKNNWYQEHK